MKLIGGGVRGSWPVAEPAFATYGGATSSFLFEGEEGSRLIIDFGTGLRFIGDRLVRDGVDEVWGLVTHFHLDHLMGLPSFPLMYRSSSQLHLAAPDHEGRSLESVLSELVKQPFWPVRLDQMRAKLVFTSLDETSGEAELICGDFGVRWVPVEHEGGCTAYRVVERKSGASAVIATDVEWQRASEEKKKDFLDLCRLPTPAQVLLFDGQYTPDEYEKFAGWGHSTWKDAAEIGMQCGIERILITHHAPTRNDAELAALEAGAQRECPGLEWARQGQVYSI